MTTVAIVKKLEITLKKIIFDSSVSDYQIPEYWVIDIDTISDFNYSEYLFKKNKWLI